MTSKKLYLTIFGIVLFVALAVFVVKMILLHSNANTNRFVSIEDATTFLVAHVKDDYVKFVTELGENIKDPKFLEAVRLLKNKYGTVQSSTHFYPVKALIPTQNEISPEKSLLFPLKNAATADLFLKGGNIAVGNNSIVTSCGGRYIIDGHHRWSQLAVMNPTSYIKSIDLDNMCSPVDTLKAVQLGIAGAVGKIPIKGVKDFNLLSPNFDFGLFKSFIVANIDPSVIPVFEKYGKGYNVDEIVAYLWSNVEYLRMNNQPATGAPKRDYMPQTDTTSGSEWQTYLPKLESYANFCQR